MYEFMMSGNSATAAGNAASRCIFVLFKRYWRQKYVPRKVLEKLFSVYII